MKRLGWLCLAVAGCSLGLVHADDRMTSRLVPVSQAEPGAKSKPSSEAFSSGLTPTNPTAVVEGECPTCEECSQTPFLDSLAGMKDWLVRRFEMPVLRSWAGADSGMIAGDVEDPYWLNFDLKWGWFRDMNVPPMLTTSNPQSSRGILGNEGTVVLFGGGDLDLKTHVGSNFTFGFWLEPSQAWGFETSYFFFGARSAGLSITSNGDTLLAAPFFNALTSLNDSVIIASQELTDPDRQQTSGLAHVYADSRLQGLEVNAVNNSFRGPTGRVDWAWGFRYLRLDEGVHNNLVTVLPQQTGQNFGTRLYYWDDFSGENSFYGFNVAMRSRWWWGCWSFDLNGKLAIGATRGTVDISGETITISSPNNINGYVGGLYALGTNIGKYGKVRFSVIPELETGISYHFYDHFRLYLNYNFLVWNNVVRPGDQIDTRINPNQFPPPTAGGPLQPEINIQTSTFWLQGLTLGLEFRF